MKLNATEGGKHIPSSSTETINDDAGTTDRSSMPLPYPPFNSADIREMDSNRIRFRRDSIQSEDKSHADDSCQSTDLVSSMISSSRKSSSGFSFGERKNVWSMMTRRRNMLKNGFDFDDDEQEIKEEDLGSLNRFDACTAYLNGFVFEMKNGVRTLCQYPYIYISTAVVFAVLTTVGLVIVEMLCDKNHDRELETARWEALETALWFSEMFAKSLIPLRSLQQAVVHSEYFKQLPLEIGNAGEPFSASLKFGPRSSTKMDYRDLTGICDNQQMIDKFEEVVAGINMNFDYDGIIVNYRLAPYVSSACDLQ